MAELLNEAQINTALADLPQWHVRGNSLHRSVTAPEFLAGIRIVDDVAEAAEEMDHHPDIDIRWTTVSFNLSTHSMGGLTEKDLALATRIDETCEQHGAS